MRVIPAATYALDLAIVPADRVQSVWRAPMYLRPTRSLASLAS